MPSTLKKAILFLTLVALLLGLGSCRAAPAAAPVPTLEVITLQYSPVLQSYQPILADCAAQVHGVGLAVQEVSATSQDLEKADLTLRLGSPPAGELYAASLGAIQLELVAHQNNSINVISLRDISALYGRTSEIGAPDVRVYTYLPGDDLRQAIESLLGQAAGRSVVEAPTQNAVIEAVTSDENAIGFLLAGQETNGLKTLRITDLSKDQLNFPVVVLAPAEPAGLTRLFVACLQAHPPSAGS